MSRPLLVGRQVGALPTTLHEDMVMTTIMWLSVALGLSLVLNLWLALSLDGAKHMRDHYKWMHGAAKRDLGRLRGRYTYLRHELKELLENTP